MPETSKPRNVCN